LTAVYALLRPAFAASMFAWTSDVIATALIFVAFSKAAYASA